MWCCNNTCPLEPIFTPVGVNCPWTETVVIRLTNYSLKHNAGIFHIHHLASSLINDPMYASQHSVDTATIRKHFRVEPKASITLTMVERRQYLFFTPHLDQFAGLQIEQLYWSFPCCSFNEWVPAAPPSFLDFVKKTDDGCMQQAQNSQNHLKHAMCSRSICEA